MNKLRAAPGQYSRKLFETSAHVGQTLRSRMYSSAHAIIKRVTSVCSGMRYLRAEAAVRLGTLTIGQV